MIGWGVDGDIDELYVILMRITAMVIQWGFIFYSDSMVSQRLSGCACAQLSPF